MAFSRNLGAYVPSWNLQAKCTPANVKSASAILRWLFGASGSC